MALYDQLPVYKLFYDLLLDIYRLSKHMDRDHKFTLGESLKKDAMELILLIYRANSVHDKVDLLSQAKEMVERIRLLLRVAKDLKQLSVKQFVVLSEKLETGSKQINSWYIYNVKSANS